MAIHFGETLVLDTAAPSKQPAKRSRSRFAFDASPARHLCAEFDALTDAAKTHADAHEDEPAPGRLANVREYLRALRMKLDELARQFGEEAMVLMLVIVAIVVLAEEELRDIVS